jgi:hypothetical protein
MSKTASSVNIGTVDLVTTAGNYNQYGTRTTSNVINMNRECLENQGRFCGPKVDELTI